MKRTGWILFACGFGTALLLLPELAWASPGGKIASAFFDTPWGKVVGAILFVFFLPLILWMAATEWLAERRTRRDLRFMAAFDSRFDWSLLQGRVKDCFHRIHRSWETEDLSGASAWMTDWYWQNQQRVHLDYWRSEGLVNVCNVKRLGRLRPLCFVHRAHEEDHEGSTLTVAITAHMQDYLADRDSGKVVQGGRRFKHVETVWTFVLDDGDWKVADIDEAASCTDFVKLSRELPPIETTAPGRADR